MTENTTRTGRGRRPGWGTTLGAAALTLSAINLVVDTGGTVGAAEAGVVLQTRATKEECAPIIKAGDDCVVISRNSVTGGAIVDKTIGTFDLGNGSVTQVDIARGAVTADALANLAVTRKKIALDAVGAGQLGDNSVSSSNVQPGSLDGSDIGTITYDNLDGVMPTFVASVAFSDVSVVSPQFIGALPEGSAAVSVPKRDFDTVYQVGADFTCAIPAEVGPEVLPCIEVPETGVYMVSMDVTWASSSAGSRIATLLLPDETHVLDGSTRNESAAGGGGVLASALPVSTDGKQVQSFSRLIQLEAGQEIILMLDYVDVALPVTFLDVSAQVSLALQ